MTDTITRSAADINADLQKLQVELAKALQPMFTDLIQAMQSDEFQAVLRKMTALSTGINNGAANVSVNINNVVNAVQQCSASLVRESQGLAATIAAGAVVSQS